MVDSEKQTTTGATYGSNVSVSSTHNDSHDNESISSSRNPLSSVHSHFGTGRRYPLPQHHSQDANHSLAWRWKRLFRVIKKRMAFKPPVRSDPRLYTRKKKRWILACLALGSSLNGFCSTVYVKSEPISLLRPKERKKKS